MMKDNAENITLEDYINSTNAAGNRVRQIVYLFFFASILAFMGYWNSRNNGWINSRYSMIQDALAYFYQDSSHKQLLSEEKGKVAKNFIDNKNLVVPKRLDDLREIYRSLKKETYLIRVPILGISFDINDLGLFSGLTFSFLLVMFWFTLEREEENLKMTFEYAKHCGKIKEVYLYLSMGQVLTLPPRSAASVGKFWNYLPKLLFTFPFVTALLIFINDMNTLEAGFIISQSATITLVATSVIFLTIITILTVLSIHRSVMIDKLWHKVFQEEIHEKDEIDTPEQC